MATNPYLSNPNQIQSPYQPTLNYSPAGATSGAYASYGGQTVYNTPTQQYSVPAPASPESNIMSAPTPSPVQSAPTQSAPAPYNASNYEQYALQNGLDVNSAQFAAFRGTNGNTGDLNTAIDQAYNPAMTYLGQAESQLRADFPGYQGEVNAQYAQGVGQADTARAGALNSINVNQTTGLNQKNDALAGARRLYGELQRGNIQRFGGASSAGGAATEIQGAEMQRQFGSTERQFRDYTTQNEQQKTQLERSYNDQVMQLQTQKSASMNNLTRDFQAKLLSINQARAETEQARSQARVQALYDLKNKAFQIDQQNTAFMQQLQAQKESATVQLDTYAKQLKLQSGSAPQYQQPAIYAQTGLSSTSPQSTSQYLGQIGTDKDKYGNPIPRR